MNAARAEQLPPLVMISPERLQDSADSPREVPEPVNGNRYGPSCAHCDEDGQV